MYAFLLMPPVSHSRLQVEFFENLFPKDKKGGEKYEDDLEH